MADTNTVVVNGDAETVLDRSLSGVTSFAVPAWPANKYKRVVINLDGRIQNGSATVTYVSMLMNADSGANYSSMGSMTNNTDTPDSVARGGGKDYCVIGAYNNSSANEWSSETTIYPVRRGFNRTCHSESAAMRDVVVSGSFESSYSSAWWNTATNVTFVTLAWGAGSDFTGGIVVKGYP